MNNLHPIFANLFKRSFPKLPVDLGQAVASEKWECTNCFRTGALDKNGRCAKCGSNAVISVEVTP
jgi:rRNA maturation endonuclease Nob1